LAQNRFDVAMSGIHVAQTGAWMVVFLDDPVWCGHGGCTLVVFEQTTMGWRQLGCWLSRGHVDVEGTTIVIDGDHGWTYVASDADYVPVDPDDEVKVVPPFPSLPLFGGAAHSLGGSSAP